MPFLMHSNKNRSKAINLANVRLSLGSSSGTIEILRGIDLTITEGETVSVIGPSGSGKTSLLMVMAGLEPVTDGEVIINGQSFLGFNEDALAEFRRDHIGIVFQSFHLVPTMTAVENVALPMECRRRIACEQQPALDLLLSLHVYLEGHKRDITT